MNNENNGNNGNKTTVDEGWRAKQEKLAAQINEARRTQVDVGWRAKHDAKTNESGSTGNATKVDSGWRAKGNATKIDAGWRARAAEMLDPNSEENKARANHFLTLESFKDAMEKVTELTSANGNVYKVKGTLSKDGGEAIVLMCTDPDGNDAVAKLYHEAVNAANSAISNRTHVLDYMGTEEGQRYTLAVREIGFIEFGESKYYFEIMPYCKDGDVSDDGAFKFEDLVEFIRQINEAMHSMHMAGIIHRDIKPHNIYKTDRGYVLGDFGTARKVDVGKGAQTHRVYGTDGYTAPELRLGLTSDPTFIYNDKIDYYSFGVTVGDLYQGHFVYQNMGSDMILVSVQTGRLPLTRTDEHREEIENLLSGLCSYDPKTRFTYEDVKKWLANHSYTGGASRVSIEGWQKGFRSDGKEYRSEKELFEGFTKDAGSWEKAKQYLYTNILADFFASFLPDLALSAKNIYNKYRNVNEDKGLSLFLKELYPAGPIVWKGYTFDGLAVLADKMLKTQTPIAYAEFLKNNIISNWLTGTKGISVNAKDLQTVNEMETLAVTEPEIACYWFANSFATAKSVTVCGRAVSTVPELIGALFGSANTFYQGDGYRKLSSRREGASLYGFLYSFGYKALADETFKNAVRLDEYNKAAVLFSMLDQIAHRSGANAETVRSFFVKFGPVGIAAYTKSLAERKASKVYTALDSTGKRALDAICSFKAPTTGSVEELFKAYSVLNDAVEALRRVLVDNPHLVLSGVYEASGVVCTNLVGVFAFRFFDRAAPLGFSAFIEADGGKN